MRISGRLRGASHYTLASPLRSRVRISVIPCVFRGGRNRACESFSRGFPCFLLSQISFHHFSTLISITTFHFISSAPVMMRQEWSVGIVANHRPSVFTYIYEESNGKLPHLFIPSISATWFLNLQWKACLCTELQPWRLSLQ